ncbi:ATP-binding cassette domain-containing protein [Hymenobacter sp. 5414T-23]|uniref:ABC transporter ATP-binding protein n=1 Tax=Hymenobacter sp. 5414T-23 TaxID=2932252 RepID=UPI001FD60A41|nr:ATP-binding cassette domain-containing protein [Hymenobacter sp. 5414T-23]UOQ82065.1 ATP-binding cassette domain-containing protein [Hymenobacter sp. 5414T-23]
MDFPGPHAHVSAGHSYGHSGPNGAGKSTLLNTLSGQLLPSAGTLAYEHQGQQIPVEEVPAYLAYAAPYLELIEELTLTELLQFHIRFKPLRSGFTPEKLISLMYLEKSRHKLVRDFSSGMKQRLKLALALYAEAPSYCSMSPLPTSTAPE